MKKNVDMIFIPQGSKKIYLYNKQTEGVIGTVSIKAKDMLIAKGKMTRNKDDGTYEQWVSPNRNTGA